jgi:penicillin V acylase-like amidase (Ntn superfamily)
VSHHLLISDPSGKSVVVEYHDGEWRVMPSKKSWQVITNSPLYNVPEEKRMLSCWRFKRASGLLEKTKGEIDWKAGMNILKSVSVKGTQWSTICDMKRQEIFISLYRDYKNIKKIIF